jgi:hypothetical protein
VRHVEKLELRLLHDKKKFMDLVTNLILEFAIMQNICTIPSSLGFLNIFGGTGQVCGVR